MITLDAENDRYTLSAEKGEVFNHTCINQRFPYPPYKTETSYSWEEDEYEPPLNASERTEVNKELTIRLEEEFVKGVTTYTFHKDNLTGCVISSPY